MLGIASVDIAAFVPTRRDAVDEVADE